MEFKKNKSNVILEFLNDVFEKNIFEIQSCEFWNLKSLFDIVSLGFFRLICFFVQEVVFGEMCGCQDFSREVNFFEIMLCYIKVKE